MFDKNSVECANNVRGLRVVENAMYLMTSAVSTAGPFKIKITIYGELGKRQAPSYQSIYVAVFHYSWIKPLHFIEPHIKAAEIPPLFHVYGPSQLIHLGQLATSLRVGNSVPNRFQLV